MEPWRASPDACSIASMVVSPPCSRIVVGSEQSHPALMRIMYRSRAGVKSWQSMLRLLSGAKDPSCFLRQARSSCFTSRLLQFTSLHRDNTLATLLSIEASRHYKLAPAHKTVCSTDSATSDVALTHSTIITTEQNPITIPTTS